jgi:peptidoglycan/xylan/chitin deacetylase (PgdA/CDA1 family)
MIENPIPWPDGARCAVAFTFDMDAESLVHMYLTETAHNRIALSSMLRYGPEVAIPRIIEAFRRFDLRQTFFIPGWCVEQYPRAIDLILKNGHEIAHHGYLHERPNNLTREQERQCLLQASEIIKKHSGAMPKGFRAPSYAFSRNTLDLLVEERFEYDASLMGHDIPYMISNGKEQIVELPSDMSLDDWTQYVCLKDFGNMLPIASPQRAVEVFQAEFDSMWRHGGLWVSVWHPFVSGRASRCDAMIGLIEHMLAKGGVWFARMDAIAEHVKLCIRGGRWKPRIDHLPFWERPLTTVVSGSGVRAD